MKKVKLRKVQRDVTRELDDWKLLCQPLDKSNFLSPLSSVHVVTDSISVGSYSDLDPSDKSSLSDNTSNHDSDTEAEFFASAGSESSSDDESIKKIHLEDALKDWSVKHIVTNAALKDLLQILNAFNLKLPKDPRTLKKTPRASSVVPLSPGNYIHFPWVSKATADVNQLNPKPRSITLKLNVDGIPIFRSSSKGLWPIQAMLCASQCVSKVFTVGVFYGPSKPDEFDLYLKPLLDDVKLLETELADVELKLIWPLDVPARSAVLCVTGHTGYYSCTKCKIKGDYYANRVTFPFGNYEPRTDQEFRDRKDPHHHSKDRLNKACIIEEFKMDVVEDVVVEPMHLMYLGVQRKSLQLLKGGKKCPARLREAEIKMMSESLLSLREHTPMEFARKQRSISELDYWKATEFRQFLLYTGPIVLNGILSDALYSHFLCLHVAARILSTSPINPSQAEYAKSLLSYYCENFGHLYGHENASHNVHNIVHLADDCLRHGTMEQISVFCFESALYLMKRLVKSNSKPLQQIHRRFAEQNSSTPFISNEKKTAPSLVKKLDTHICHFHQENAFENIQVFKECVFNGFTVRSSAGDNAVVLKSGQIVLIECLFKSDKGDEKFVGRHFRASESFYHSPCNSEYINCRYVSQLSATRVFDLKEIDKKGYLIPHRNKSFFLPLLHCESY